MQDRRRYRNGLRLCRKSVPYIDAENCLDVIAAVENIKKKDPEISTECDALTSVVQELTRSIEIH